MPAWTRVRYIFLTSLYFWVSGCASFTPIRLDETSLSELRGAPRIGVGLLPRITFVEICMEVENREDLARRYRLANPVGRMKDSFLAGLVTEKDFAAGRFADERLMTALTTDLEALKVTVGSDVPLAFQFGTIQWWGIQCAYKGYQVVYAARARLVRLDGAPRVLWDDLCHHVTKDSIPLEALTTNDAELLKTKLAEAADQCAAELLAKFVPASVKR